MPDQPHPALTAAQRAVLAALARWALEHNHQMKRVAIDDQDAALLAQAADVLDPR